MSECFGSFISSAIPSGAVFLHGVLLVECKTLIVFLIWISLKTKDMKYVLMCVLTNNVFVFTETFIQIFYPLYLSLSYGWDRIPAILSLKENLILAHVCGCFSLWLVGSIADTLGGRGLSGGKLLTSLLPLLPTRKSTSSNQVFFLAAMDLISESPWLV